MQTETLDRAAERLGWLPRFVAESNRIEGITRSPTMEEAAATTVFLDLPGLTVADVEALVTVYEPGAVLRRSPDLNVRVGNHVAPAGGPAIETELAALLNVASWPGTDPWQVHCNYEHLHPFTDGNGCSGRALWLWMMLRAGPRDAAMARDLGFLHAFYYQTLAQDRAAG